MTSTTPYIIMMEDDTDDQSLTTDTLSTLNIDVLVKFLHSSQELFTLLSTVSKPTVILIDYDISPGGGIEILKSLKAHQEYKTIPVVILGDSNRSKYVTECYAHGANSYIQKPTNLEETRNKIGTFFKYWLQVVEV